MFVFSIYSSEIPCGYLGAVHCGLLSCVLLARLSLELRDS